MPKHQPPERINIEGHRGGSFVEIQRMDPRDPEYNEEVVYLRVGHSCVHTVDQKINVAALALILSEFFGPGYEDRFKECMQKWGWQGQDDLFIPYERPERKRRNG